MSRFNECYAVTRKYEGGKVDDPADPGGRTNKGVTQRRYDIYRRSFGKPTQDVYLISDAEVRDIYYSGYWLEAKCDTVPAGIDMLVFDTAINSGSNRSIRILQQSINVCLEAARRKPIRVDGSIGDETRQGIKGLDLTKLAREFCAQRLAFLKSLKTWGRFGRGWTARVQSSLSVALDMIARVKPAYVAVPTQAVPKSDERDMQHTAVTVETAGKALGGSVAATGVVDAVKNAAGTFQTLADVSDVLRWLFIVLTVGLAAYTIYAAIVSSRNRKALDGSSSAARISEVPNGSDVNYELVRSAAS